MFLGISCLPPSPLLHSRLPPNYIRDPSQTRRRPHSSQGNASGCNPAAEAGRQKDMWIKAFHFPICVLRKTSSLIARRGRPDSIVFGTSLHRQFQPAGLREVRSYFIKLLPVIKLLPTTQLPLAMQLLPRHPAHPACHFCLGHPAPDRHPTLARHPDRYRCALGLLLLFPA